VTSPDHCLAIDVGTQSVRAILFDPRGALVAMGRVPIEPYVSPQPGWAEQDPEVWWDAIGEACRRLWADPAARPDSVAGVGLTTQRATIVVADRDGKPLRPAIVWLDTRRTGTHEAAGLGAAIDVALGVGIHPDPETAVSEMVHVTDRFEPASGASRIYEDLYQSVYLKMYDRLQPLYREIRRITGYPPA
jgi:sugar (pentulose or hexulose) kinase